MAAQPAIRRGRLPLPVDLTTAHRQAAPISATDHTQRNLEVWEAIADGWESRADYIEAILEPVSDWMLRALRPAPAQALLELAGGTGELGYRALTAAGADARLVSTDISPALVDAARRRAAVLGLDHVEHRTMTIERLELGDGEIDGVLCRHGFMFASDPGDAFAEVRRVLRPGGRVVLSVWGAPDRNPFFAPLGRVLVQRGHAPAPQPGTPGLFALADPERLRGLLAGAGFDEVTVEEIELRFEFEDVETFLAISADSAGGAALVLRRLTDDELAAVAGDLRDAFAPFASDGGYALPGIALCAAAA